VPHLQNISGDDLDICCGLCCFDVQTGQQLALPRQQRVTQQHVQTRACHAQDCIKPATSQSRTTDQLGKQTAINCRTADSKFQELTDCRTADSRTADSRTADSRTADSKCQSGMLNALPCCTQAAPCSVKTPLATGRLSHHCFLKAPGCLLPRLTTPTALPSAAVSRSEKKLRKPYELSQLHPVLQEQHVPAACQCDRLRHDSMICV